MTTEYIKEVMSNNSETYFSYGNLNETGIGNTIVVGEPIKLWENKPGEIPEYDSRYHGFTIKLIDGSLFNHGDGDGQEIDLIFEVDGILYCVTGYYSSYGESEMDYYGGINKVESYQKTITAYRNI
jgi:hypothetical protein